MILLICQDRPAGQYYNPTHFIKGEQLFKLTAIDLNTALINEMFENPRSKTTFRALMYKITPPSSSVSMRSPIHMESTPFKKGTKPDDPPQNVDKPHLSASISTITNLDVTCTLDTSCDHLLHLDSPSHSSEPQDISTDHLLHLDSPSHSSEPQDISSAESVEIEFIDESEEPLEINKPSPTDVFSSYHEYDLFLLNQEIDTPSYNLNSQNTHACENLDDILIHATNLSHTFALPQSMAQHNCEDLKPTDTPSTVPAAFQASSYHTFNPKCAHNTLATQCNQSQYDSLKHNFALPQFIAEHNCEYQEPTNNPSAVQPLSKFPVITPSILCVLIT